MDDFENLLQVKVNFKVKITRQKYIEKIKYMDFQLGGLI